MGTSEARDAIEQLMKLWPKDHCELEESIRARLQGKIADALPLPSLRAVPVDSWRLASPPLVWSGVCKALLAETKRPYAVALAEFHLQSDGWLLTYFERQCPACFGTGINDRRLCDFCFGAGWGVQANDYAGESGATEAIEELIEALPKGRKEAEDEIRRRVGAKVANGLPLPGLRAVAKGHWQIASPPLVSDGVCKCLLIDTKSPLIKVLIELRLGSGGWLLTAFDSECRLCAGVGTNNGGICKSCFGRGWGVHVEG